MENGNRGAQRSWGGRPRKLSSEALSLARQLYYEEGMSVRDVADAVRVSHMTVWRALCGQRG